MGRRGASFPYHNFFQTKTMRRFALITAAALALLGIWAATSLLGGGTDPGAFHGTYLGEAPAPTFTLESADGPVRLADYRGRLVTLFFGYTSCPDFCPTTLAKLARVRDLLGPEASELQVVLITVDPERDDAARLKAYVTAFDTGFVGLTGSMDQIRQVAGDYGIAFQKAEPPMEGMDPGAMEGHEGHQGYVVNHGLYTMAIDAEGRHRLIWGSTVTAQQMADDLRLLLEE